MKIINNYLLEKTIDYFKSLLEFWDSSITQDNVYYKLSRFPLRKFVRDIYKTFKTKKIASIIESIGIKWFYGISTIKIHRFFIPEFIYILENLPSDYTSVIKLLKENTWVKNMDMNFSSKINISKATSEINLELQSYQKDFINIYDSSKRKYLLDGYILAFEQGLGKTITSLALMKALEKDAVIIVVPKSTIRTVWVPHINQYIKKNKKIWVVNEPNQSSDSDYFIINYESLDKFNSIFSFLKNKNVGIIVDESHNFLHLDSKRTQNLLNLKNKTNCKDVLLMSGTPLKALGIELLPILIILDSMFDEEARKIFIKSFGLSSKLAAQILNTRIDLVMHRKLKIEVLNLPPKHEKIIQIKTPDAKLYTTDSVRTAVFTFIEERKKYYNANKFYFEKEFEEVIDYLKNLPELNSDKDFNRYLKIIQILKEITYNRSDVTLRENVRWANLYEKNVIYLMLPNDLKKKFLRSKSVVKYVHLKIMGEVIGGLLIRLRTQMIRSLIKYANLDSIIKNSEKKTVIYTSFVDCVEEADNYFSKKGFTPALVYGKTSNNVKKILEDFKSNDKINPLIATIQTLSTGITVTEANTVIFLNKPWRHVEYQQASDRVHRIGQDSEVYIYTLLLDTGNIGNLSTKMEEIMNWSKELFDILVNKK